MRRLLAVVLVVAAVLAVACGVPKDSHPREIEAQQVPFDLLAPTTSTTAAKTSGPTREVTIYFADATSRLVAVKRQVEAPATLPKALTSMLAGPAPEEADHLHTPITTETKLLNVRGPVDGLVTIDFSRSMLDVKGSQQILAFAEVVYTATAFPGVDRVLFQFDGATREVPNGDGTLTSTPLGRLSYRKLATG
jgi:spore germination protein GerM